MSKERPIAALDKLIDAINAANDVYRTWAQEWGVDTKGKEFFGVTQNKELLAAVHEKISEHFEQRVRRNTFGQDKSRRRRELKTKSFSDEYTTEIRERLTPLCVSAGLYNDVLNDFQIYLLHYAITGDEVVQARVMAAHRAEGGTVERIGLYDEVVKRMTRHELAALKDRIVARHRAKA